MNGKIGGIYEGKRQVGGLIDWNLDINLTDGEKDGAKIYRLSTWRVNAGGYWFYKPVTRITVRLFTGIGLSYWEGTGIVDSTTKGFVGVLIHERLSILGSGILEGKP